MTIEMKYVSRVLKNACFLRALQEVKQYEADRIYCHHEMEHALDVCRIAWIGYLEDHLYDQISDAEWQERKERIYVSGLLHDIGRAAQYATGEHHSIAGVRLARQILSEIEYPQDWADEALQIIAEHYGRGEKNREKDAISYYIEKADQLSRNCFCCEAQDSCKWSDEERNRTIVC